MSGISRMIAKELSSALGIIDNPKYNPMFKQTEEVLTDVADPSDPTVARFYSPLESAIDEAPIGKEGTRGENIEAFVRKRAPKVTQAEMEYRGLGLEPDVKYTREALSGIKQKESTEQILKDFETINNYSYIEISDSLDDWIYNNNPKALDKMMSIGHMYDYYRQEVQDHLSYLFDGKKIPVQRIEGYADPFAKKKKTVTTIDVDDVIAIGNPTEREIITKQPDTGRYVSYSLLTDELLKPLELKAFKDKRKQYKGTQIQLSLFDDIEDYEEIKINAFSDKGSGLYTSLSNTEVDKSFNYVSHFDPNTIAHARYTVRKNEDDRYILIEELQSDPLQNVVDDLPTFKKKQRNILDTDLNNLYREAEYLIETGGSGFPDKPIKELKGYIEEVVIPTRLNKKLSREDRIDLFKREAKKLGVKEEYLFGDTGSISRVAGALLRKEYDGDDYEIDAISDAMYNSVERYLADLTIATTKKDLPVQSITDSVRISLQSIIADAKAKGIDEIVLPPIEKLAKERFVYDTKEELAAKIAKGSAFHNTYVAAYNKVLKQLKAELGNQVSIGKRKLKYEELRNNDINDRYTKEYDGVSLDISNLTIDPTNIKLRFNKGGLVERPTK